jgi:hypothetical protein
VTETPTETDPAETDPAPPTGAAPTPPPLPPDPVAYDSPRAVRARAKGLQAPYIAGGEDPDPAAALEVDRHYGRLLVAMAVTIVASGFVIGTIVALLGPTGGR